MYKFRFGEAARGVTFVPSYLDFGTFVRFFQLSVPASRNVKQGFAL